MRRIGRDLHEEPSEFQPTIWSCLDRAQRGEKDAIERVYRQYRRPVFLFLSRRMAAGADAEALADDVMQTILRPEFLAGADRSKGRFRDLLLAVTRNTLGNAARRERARKRGGGRRPVSLEEIASAVPASEDERRDFDHFYAEELMQGARDLLREDDARRGGQDLEILGMYYDQGLPQAEIAARTGRSVATLNTTLDRARKRLRKHFIGLLRLVCSTPGEVEEELNYLLTVYADRRRTRVSPDPPGSRGRD